MDELVSKFIGWKFSNIGTIGNEYEYNNYEYDYEFDPNEVLIDGVLLTDEELEELLNQKK